MLLSFFGLLDQRTSKSYYMQTVTGIESFSFEGIG